MIAVNGDVAPTFLVDGVVAGTWDVPRRGPAGISLRPLIPLAERDRRAVIEEGRRLLAWLRPDAGDGRASWS